MEYKKGDSLRKYDEIVEDKQFSNKYNEYLEKMKLKSELQFDFNDKAHSSLYIYQLLKNCNEIDLTIQKQITEIKNLNSGCFGRKNSLKDYLDTYLELSKSEYELKLEINDFQKYSVTLYSNGVDNEIPMLIDYYKTIEKDLLIIFDLINTKLNEISSSRLAVTNFIVSVVAITISVVAIFVAG
jgi:hypothetical protein